MLTLFAVPKPFLGHIGIIQRNALQSWIRISKECEVILFGDEEGTAQAAARFGAIHVPKILRNEFGTPLLNDVFQKAQEMASHDVVCYVNADIILTSDFIKAVESVSRWKKVFLMVGRRWDVKINRALDFEHPDWDGQIRAYAREHGWPRSAEWIDYFVFPRGFYRDLPPFAIGRAAFDNWLLWKAHSLGAPLVDASDVVIAVHQNHDYSHHPQGQKGVWEGPEAARNRELMETWRHCFLISDATYRLRLAGVERNFTWEYFGRRLDRIRIRLWEAFMKRTRPLRHRLGIRRSNIDRLARMIRKAVGISYDEGAKGA